MRIIAGKLRGRKLASIQGTTIRPTADRTREALFNILGQKPRDSVVLDLFCGSGALGLEALSRGACKAVFVDNDSRSLAVLRQNISRCQMASCSQVIRWDLLKNFNALSGKTLTFDLVFIDPPYLTRAIRNTLAHLVHGELLNPDALVVAEHHSDELIDEAPDGLEIVDRRRYGRTMLTLLSVAP